MISEETIQEAAEWWENLPLDQKAHLCEKHFDRSNAVRPRYGIGGDYIPIKPYEVAHIYIREVPKRTNGQGLK